MPKKIKDLFTPTIPLTGGELMEMSQSNVSVKVLLNQLIDKFKGIFAQNNSINRHDYVVSPRGETTGTYFTSAGSFPVSAGYVGLDRFGQVVFKNRIWIIGGNLDNGSYQYESNTQVFSSNDGLTWIKEGDLNIDGDGNEETFLTSGNDNAIFFNNKVWFIAPTVAPSAFSFGTYSSSDGINWTKEGEIPKVYSTSILRQFNSVVVYDDKMWIIGGVEENLVKQKFIVKIFYSEDGKKWIEAGTDSLPITTGVSYPSVFSFNDLLWIAGGNPSAGAQLDDVFYSSDGINWTTLNNVLPAPGSNFSEFVYDGKIWIGQPKTPNAFSNTFKFWYSDNGSNWTEVESNITTISLSYVPYNGRIFGLGGRSGAFIWRNDVWVSDLLFSDVTELKLLKRNTDPQEPEEGNGTIWISDGTGKGNDGDFMIASKVNGQTRFSTLFIHASGAAW